MEGAGLEKMQCDASSILLRNISNKIHFTDFSAWPNFDFIRTQHFLASNQRCEDGRRSEGAIPRQDRRDARREGREEERGQGGAVRARRGEGSLAWALNRMYM